MQRRRARAEQCRARHSKFARRRSASFALQRAGGDRRPRAASAAITSWCGAIGRSGSGAPPRHMISGVPEHVDGRMLDDRRGRGRRHHQSRPHVALPRRHPELGADLDRHGIRILPGPSSLWLDARGQRLPVPLFPGFDSLGTLEHITRDRLRLFLVRADAEHHRQGIRALGLGAESGSHRQELAAGAAARVGKGAPGPVRRSWSTAPISSSRDDLAGAGRRHERSSPASELIDAADCDHAEIVARDREIDNKFGKDAQIMAIRAARAIIIGDKLIRVAQPHRILDPAAGPLIAVQAQHPDPQDARRTGDRSRRPRLRRRRRSRCPASMRRARSRASAAAACTATARSKARFSAAAFSRDGRQAAPRRAP